MTDENESTDSQQRQAPPSGQNKGAKGWFWFLLSLVVLGAIVAAAWHWLPEPLARRLQTLPIVGAAAPATSPADSDRVDNGQLQSQAPPVQSSQPALNRLPAADANGRLARQLQQQSRTIRQLQRQLSQLQQRVAAQEGRLKNLAGGRDWQLVEADNLLRLANQRLLLERDSRSALSLLEEADSILSRLNQPGLYPVRRQLAEDLSALKLTQHVDREGIYLRLRAVEGQMLQLSLKPDFNAATPRADASAPEQGQQSPLRRSWQAFVNFLHSAVRIEDGGINPVLLSSQNAFYFRQSLRLHMEQAELALLRADATVYRDALEDARQLLVRYGVDNRQRRTILSQLQSLQAAVVANQLPDLNTVQNALRSYMAQLQRGEAANPPDRAPGQQPSPEASNGPNNADTSGGDAQ